MVWDGQVDNKQTDGQTQWVATDSVLTLVTPGTSAPSPAVFCKDRPGIRLLSVLSDSGAPESLITLAKEGDNRKERYVYMYCSEGPGSPRCLGSGVKNDMFPSSTWSVKLTFTVMHTPVNLKFVSRREKTVKRYQNIPSSMHPLSETWTCDVYKGSGGLLRFVVAGGWGATREKVDRAERSTKRNTPGQRARAGGRSVCE
ncbi:hypothetical protein J6590_035507 [Homalodisca vitripennis]|nr:hypothetical protein J6590_035507 [Homalodisca vitripennis]